VLRKSKEIETANPNKHKKNSWKLTEEYSGFSNSYWLQTNRAQKQEKEITRNLWN
jgi:hypothetical protein